MKPHPRPGRDARRIMRARRPAVAGPEMQKHRDQRDLLRYHRDQWKRFADHPQQSSRAPETLTRPPIVRSPAESGSRQQSLIRRSRLKGRAGGSAIQVGRGLRGRFIGPSDSPFLGVGGEWKERKTIGGAAARRWHRQEPAGPAEHHPLERESFGRSAFFKVTSRP